MPVLMIAGPGLVDRDLGKALELEAPMRDQGSSRDRPIQRVQNPARHPVNPRRTSMRVLIALAGVAGQALAPGAWAQAGIEAAMNRAGCLSCHAKDRKLVGPAYKDVAARYKGQADMVARLMDKTRKGGSGVYGPVPMPPHPAERISDADLKAAIEWILKQ